MKAHERYFAVSLMPQNVKKHQPALLGLPVLFRYEEYVPGPAGEAVCRILSESDGPLRPYLLIS